MSAFWKATLEVRLAVVPSVKFHFECTRCDAVHAGWPAVRRRGVRGGRDSKPRRARTLPAR